MATAGGQQDSSDPGDVVPSFARDLPLTRDAIRCASEVHRDRRRDSDQAPFILHPLEVAAMLRVGGAADPVVAAGVLHDVVEAHGLDLPQIEERFGPGVSALVGAVSEDQSIEPYGQRKAALRVQVGGAGPDAGSIFAADKVAKIRELRVRIGHARQAGRLDPVDVEAKLEHYAASLAMLDGLIPASPLVHQLRFELEALLALPPGRELDRAEPAAVYAC